ncbi:hypothetical protein OUZ56_030934 [Daphnia magna]|uniref:G-protein coupled receptors family 1 profile domain-containing protein n=1 Tax=Daphnia magna TaxID=35525 RepID=A0ABQ9ZT41_9CRUS|nr:hypothetical protein OUZ56_030934 [Daphnia magna]
MICDSFDPPVWNGSRRGEDAGCGRGHLRYVMAALSWHVGVQQFCHHALETQFYGPLVPHVCQNVRLHQQRIMNSVGIYCESSAINPILYTAMSIKFRRAFQRILLCGRGYEKLLFAWTRLTQSTVSYLKRALLP